MTSYINRMPVAVVGLGKSWRDGGNKDEEEGGQGKNEATREVGR